MIYQPISGRLSMSDNYSRRQFIRQGILSGMAVLLTACRAKFGLVTEPTATIEVEPTPVIHTPTHVSTVTTAATATATPNYVTSVALRRQASYGNVKDTIRDMIKDIGGVEDIVKPGAHVGIKLNLTGGTWWDTPDKPPATEYFVTHPAVAGAVAEIFLEAGASKVTMMDGLGDKLIFKNWGYEELASQLGIHLIDLCEPYPYDSFLPYSTGDKYLIYPAFLLHPILKEIDTFVSIAKLKVHATAGVTLSMKNLIGLAPINSYRNNDSHNNRSSFHGNSNFDERLPKVIIDLNRVCPIDLAIIDGISTAEGGAGPWESNMRQIKPQVLLAGKDCLATDTIGTLLMGFDPFASGGEIPFNGGLNHLLLANESGLGCMEISKIHVIGENINDMKINFLKA
jgi:uncharacterized protein (DUF362 family)